MKKLRLQPKTRELYKVILERLTGRSHVTSDMAVITGLTKKDVCHVLFDMRRLELVTSARAGKSNLLMWYIGPKAADFMHDDTKSKITVPWHIGFPFLPQRLESPGGKIIKRENVLQPSSGGQGCLRYTGIRGTFIGDVV